MRRLISLLTLTIVCASVLPPELMSLNAQDQNIELEKDSAEKEIDDNGDVDLKFYAPPPSTSSASIISFAKKKHDTIPSLFFEEVPTPPPLFR